MNYRSHGTDSWKPALCGLPPFYALPILGVLFVVGCGSKEDASHSESGEPLESGRFEGHAELASRDLHVPDQAHPAGTTMFETVDAAAAGMDFEHTWEMRIDTLERFDKLEAGGGVAIGDVDGDGLPDVLLTRPFGGVRLYRNLGGFRFEDVTKAAGLGSDSGWPTGAAFGDIDNDGDLDLVICAFDSPTRLYINDSTGKFTEQAKARGLEFVGSGVMVAFSDYDRDGDLDAFLATNRYAKNLIDPRLDESTYITSLIQRDADGGFSLPPSVDELWGLIERPGQDPWVIRTGQRGRLFRNEGGRFAEVGEAAGLDDRNLSLSATWWDHNGDGWPDLYIANDFMGADRLYENMRDGTFRDVAPDVLPHVPWYSMGSDVGDINNDGLDDFIATDMAGSTHYKSKLAMGDMDKFAWFLESGAPRQYMRNAVYLNTGTGRKMEVAQQLHLAASDWTWSPKFGDFDCDGWLDIFITNGMTGDWFNSDAQRQSAFGHRRPAVEEPEKRDANMAFRNRGGLEFENVGAAWGLSEENVSFGAALADLDLDGDLDLVVNRFKDKVALYRNGVTTGARVRVELRGRHSNSFGLGTTVAVSAGGMTQTRTLTLTRGVISANEPVLHFGLGDAEGIDALTVRWPSGHAQTFTGLAIGKIYEITEPTAAPPGFESPSPPATPLFVRDKGFPELRHQEAAFDDFAEQPLLPNRMSRLGPGVAIGDVDGDGAEDAYLGAAAGSDGTLLLRDGQAWKVDQRNRDVFAQARRSEDMGTLLFEADGDGDLDLYVVSGGVESHAGDGALADRLYLNDGTGVFTLATDALPLSRDSGSCVVAADVDADGDLDLFVGGRVVPGDYPMAPPSRLLRNDSADGMVRFTDVTAEIAPDLVDTGMVTAALWSDADADGDPDLLVTHEWGPVKLFRNTDGRLEDATMESGLDRRLGWWNGIVGGDVDGDGDTDYAVSNFGLNTKYHPSESKPVAIYYGDFSGDGKKQIVEAKQTADGLLPVRGFSCSSAAIPGITNKMGYQTPFHNFATKALAEIYTQERLDQALHLEVNELRGGILINNGSGIFTFEPLPPLAQIAPGFGMTFCDADGDAPLDLMLGQNFFSPQPETGRMDGGVSLILRGVGDGTFEPLWPETSGVSIPGDAKGVARLAGGELLIAQNDGTPLLLKPAGGISRSCVLRLIGNPGNPSAVGARLFCSLGDLLTGTFEVYAGSGYLSTSSSTITVPLGPTSPEAIPQVEIHWPDGSTSSHRIAAEGLTEIQQP